MWIVRATRISSLLKLNCIPPVGGIKQKSISQSPHQTKQSPDDADKVLFNRYIRYQKSSKTEKTGEQIARLVLKNRNLPDPYSNDARGNNKEKELVGYTGTPPLNLFSYALLLGFHLRYSVSSTLNPRPFLYCAYRKTAPSATGRAEPISRATKRFAGPLCSLHVLLGVDPREKQITI